MNIRYPVLLLVGTALWLSAWAAAAAGEKTPPAASVPPSAKQMRQAVERSLVFLQKSADDWYERGQLHSVEFKDGRKIVGGTVQKKCVSCHHLPMTIWALTEAKEHGFTVDDKALNRLRDQALAPHLRTPDLKPVVGNQDSRGDSKTVMNAIYLSIASAATAKPDAQALDAMKKFAAHLLDMQETDGRWRASKTEYQPPVIDIDEVLTMQALLVLATAHERGHVDAEKWATSRARALEWLRRTKLRDQHQSLALNVLVSQRFGKPEETQPLLKKLLQTQNADGGWSQVKELKSDALATGQTLYVLAIVGDGSADQQRAMQRAQAFLMDTQLKDGSWWVPTRTAPSKGRKGQASSHYGTGWATVGLIRMLGNVATTLEGAGDKDKVKNGCKRAELSGLELEVCVPEQSKAGSEIVCTVTATNKSKKPITYGRQGANVVESHLRHFSWAVKDAQGKVVPTTRYGKMVFEEEDLKFVKRTILPGQSINMVTFNLARVFDLSVAGEYSLKISAMSFGPEGGEISVDGVRFTVKGD